MKSLKRVLALVLAVVLVMGLIPSGVSAEISIGSENKSTALESRNPQAGKVIWSADFNIVEEGATQGYYDFAVSTKTENVTTSNDAAVTTPWYNYAPGISEDGKTVNVRVYLNSGEIKLIGGHTRTENELTGWTGSASGDECIKVENVADGTKARLQIALPEANDCNLEPGKQYLFSAWVWESSPSDKLHIGAQQRQTFTAQSSGSNDPIHTTAKQWQSSNASEAGKWQKVEVPLVYKSGMNIFIGLASKMDAGYYFLVDKLEVSEYGVSMKESCIVEKDETVSLDFKTSSSGTVVEYTSLDPEIASVENGTVKGLKKGQTSIEVKVYMPIPKISSKTYSSSINLNTTAFEAVDEENEKMYYVSGVTFSPYTQSTTNEIWATAYGFARTYTVPVTVIGSTATVANISELTEKLSGADDVVQLSEAITSEGAALIIPADKTLDLNGKTLTVNSLAALKGANVIDSVGGGKIVVAQGNLMLQKNNTQLPVRAEDDSGYLFFAVKNQHNQNGNTETALGYNTRPSLGSTDTNGQYLADGAADNGLTIMVRLTWTNSSGLATTMDVAATDSLIQSVYGGTGAISLTASGVSNLTNFKVATVIVSDTGVEHVGEALTYTYSAPEA